jgi:hypothetical protein
MSVDTGHQNCVFSCLRKEFLAENLKFAISLAAILKKVEKPNFPMVDFG